jgi:NADPH-dependent curcumin reductase CurA
MKKDINRQWLLAARPKGMVKESDFKYREEPIPEPRDGQFLVRNLYIAFEPAMRGWIEDRPSYMTPVQLGEVMRAVCVGQVVASKHPNFQPGDCVTGGFGWQDYVATNGRGGLMPTTKVPGEVPLTMPLSVLGITGLTAYFGMLDVGRPQAGETVVVSGAAGATGSVAGQIAKIKGCRVIGIAGGQEKCRWLTSEAHFDAAIDYKAEPVEERLKALCPNSINIYFDNVGGDILDAALACLAQKARVVLCGGISRYNEEQLPPGPKNYFALILQRARMEGFILIDYASRFGEALPELAGWVATGQIKYQEDIQEGFENAPKAFLRLFEGKNLGKQLLKIADPPLVRK